MDLLLRPPMDLGDIQDDPAVVAQLAREIRELAELRLGHEMVVDANIVGRVRLEPTA